MNLEPLARGVYDSLLERIARLELPPGEHLVERTLADELGVSRTPLREALRRLAAQGLVEDRRHRGCFVSRRSLHEVGLMCEARQAIEGMAARLWAQRAAPAAVASLRETIARLAASAQAGSLVDYYQHDFGFHRQLIRLCDNPYIAEFTNAEALILGSFINTPLLPIVPGGAEGQHTSLAGVLAAIEAHDPQTAEATIRRHIAAFHEQVQRMAEATAAPGLPQ